jgi:hypothetical protein
MRLRERGPVAFLERPADWWAVRLPQLAHPGVVNELLSFAGVLLAGMGELTGDEVARLERIAAGLEVHPRVAVDAARRILERRP